MLADRQIMQISNFGTKLKIFSFIPKKRDLQWNENGKENEVGYNNFAHIILPSKRN